MGDLRALNRGKKPLLNDFQQAQLHQVLTSPSPDGGLWNGRKVAEWMSLVTGKKVSRMRGWEYSLANGIYSQSTKSRASRNFYRRTGSLEKSGATPLIFNQQGNAHQENCI